jgi:hypothetical protein
MDIYQDANAFYAEGPFRRTPRAGSRLADGTIRSLPRAGQPLRARAGTRSRSGLQFDIWEAVYSPVGEDGYPQRIFDKTTGVIDRRVAEHWRDNYDLGHILTRDWARLGPKLRGKIPGQRRQPRHLLPRPRRAAPRGPPARAGLGRRLRLRRLDGHCWSGDPDGDELPDAPHLPRAQHPQSWSRASSRGRLPAPTPRAGVTDRVSAATAGSTHSTWNLLCFISQNHVAGQEPSTSLHPV